MEFTDYLKRTHKKDFLKQVNANSTIQNDLEKLKTIFESMHEIDKDVVETVTKHFKYKWFQQSHYQQLIDVEHSQSTTV